MEDRTALMLVESIDKLTSAMTELAVKVKRLTNSPITPDKYKQIKDHFNNG